MRTAAICPTCATNINALCVIYNGPNLTNTNVATLDTLEVVIQKINNNLVPRYGSGAPTNSAVYEGQIYIDNATGDVYIATATGGGPADWVELAYQSAIPATPSLDDVLLVGNTSTTSVVIQDLLVAPTQTNTMMSDGNELSDLTQNLSTSYHVNDIYVTDTTTGNFLQIAIDNTQNQTITFPDTSGQLALLSDTVLTLQDVTNNGNLTDDPIFADSFSSTATYISNFSSLLGYEGNGTTAIGFVRLREESTGTGFTSTISPSIPLAVDRNIFLPDADGTMVLTVNGNIPDNQGNVVVAGLPTTSTLQDVLTNGNSSTGISIEIQDSAINVYDAGVVNYISLDGTTGVVSITTGGGTGNIAAANLSDLRNFQLPDQSGTFALLSDIPTPLYKSFVGKISQSPLAIAPVIDFTLQNDFTNPITFTYNSPGNYTLNCLDIVLNKTVVFLQNGYSGLTGNFGTIINGYASINSIDIVTLNLTLGLIPGTPADGLLNASIEIRVYP